MNMSHSAKLLIIMVLSVVLLSTPLAAQDAQYFNNQGKSFVQRKMWDKAIEAFQRAIALQPQNFEVHNNLGFALEEAGYYKEALTEYEVALKIKPDYKPALENILSGAGRWSQDLIDHGQYSAAEDILKAGIARAPDAGELYYFLGVVYQAMGKSAESLAMWKKAAQIRPDSSIAHYVKAVEKASANDYPGAVNELNEAIKKKPDNAYAHNLMGIILATMGKPQEAIAKFETAIKYKPNYAEAYLSIATLYERAGKMDDAIKYYKTATIKNPYSVRALMHMGKIYFTAGRFFDAESCYQRALRTQPLSAPIYNDLAFTLAQQNKMNEAIKAFETAAQLNPKNIDAHYALGLIYFNNRSKGQEYAQKAAEEFQKCMAIDPSHKYSALAAQKLAELGGQAPVATSSPGITQTSVAPIVCESPDGDLSLAIAPEWQGVTVQGEGSDKYLWVMAQPAKGLTLTVYKPQGVPVNNLSMIKDYAVKEAEKKGVKKTGEAPVKVGSFDAFRVELADPAGKNLYLYVTVNNKKAYIFIAEAQSAALGDVEKVISSVQLK
ncbi:MAG: tetratricopeptide repeat protein [Vulcanimicrobiota bacterium]